jgi:YVTN family beta-propeller protein
MFRVRQFRKAGALLVSLVGVIALASVLVPSPLAAPGAGGAGQPSHFAVAASPGPNYPVVFAESGLPLGTNWSVTINGTAHSSTARTVLFYEPNGTYSYSVRAKGGYLASPSTGNVTVQGGNDTVVGTISIPGSQPWGGATDPLTGNVYMAFDQKNNLSIINGSTNKPSGNFGVGNSPGSPIFDPVDGDFFVPNWGNNNVTVFNPVSHVRSNVNVGQNPFAGVFDPANDLVYIANTNGASVSALNGSSGAVVATIPVGQNPYGVAYNPITHQVYVANFNSNNVSIISGTPGKASGNIPLPANSNPYGIAYDGANAKLYVTEQGSAAHVGGVYYGAVINGSTNAYLGTFVEGNGAAIPSFDPVNDLLYVPDTSSASVTVIGPVNSTVVGSIPVGMSPYTVVADAPSGFVYVPNYGGNSVTIINGNFYLRSIGFSPKPPTYYPLNFTESGLPSGTNWSVTVNGTTLTSNLTTLSLSVLNGTYAFMVGSVSGYLSTPTSGDAVVNGTNVSVPIFFVLPPPALYSITFIESGLPAGTGWGVTFNGTLTTATTDTIEFNGTNGTYSFTASPVRGYSPSPGSGNVSVAGNGVTVPIQYALLPPPLYAVEFQESGLPSATSWSVTVGSNTLSGTASALWVNESNGTYAYIVGTVSGHSAKPSSGDVTVDGAGLTITIQFNNSSSGGGGPGGSGGGGGGGSPPGSKPSGGSPLGSLESAWLLLLIVAAIAAVGIALIASRRRRKQGSGTSIAAIAAEAGLPPPIAHVASSSVPASAPSTGVPPAPTLPAATPAAPPPPPPKPAWSEE